jgi:anaerobic magnesium-protoporphyrin IX monomethyl ester cyclase
VADVLFGQSYYLRFDPKLWRAMQPYPPLGTLYAAALARSRGYEVALFDAMLAGSEEEWDAALARASPRFAVLFEDSFNYLSKMCLLRMREAALRMVAMARRRGIPAIVCGSDASDHAGIYLDAGATCVIVGEGEATLVELLDRSSGRATTPLASIPGTAFRDESGALRSGPPRPVLRDLDALPFPAWDLVDAPRYRSVWNRRHGHYSVNMVTTRGCPYHCNWCAKPIWGQTYNSRSPENVADELVALRRTLAPDHVWFADDIFGLKPGWIARYADAVEARGARTPFKCLSRADLLLRPGEIESLARAGARTVWIGAESGSQKILDAMEKGTRVEQIRQAAAGLRAAGVRVGFFLQFGYPGETRGDIDKTVALVRACLPDEIGMSVSYPLPGTRFYERVKDELGARRNWVDSDDLAMLYRGPYSTAFYRRLYTVVQKDFRMRDGLREVRAALGRPDRLRPRHLRRLAAASFHALTLPLARRRLERAAREPHDGLGPLAPGLSPEEAAHPTPQGGA